jgi:tRNA nucleotidyltransferase (CCA-adding enzyme)
MTAYDVIAAVNEIVPCWLVGGAVRDTLLHIPPKDYDFCTALPPSEIECRIREAGRKPYLIGAKYGTVGMKVKVCGEYVYVEITTYRTEDCSGGGRHPNVQFVPDIEQDLARRDFTCNAIAARYDYNAAGLEFVDPFDGRCDIRHSTLKAVGTPWRRFTEDPLRILRMYRFVSQLGFEVDDRTRKQAARNAYKLLTVSKERITAEMDKLLGGRNVAAALQMMWEDGAFKWFLPELQLQYNFDQRSPYHGYNLHLHTAYTVVGAQNGNPAVAWAALLHDIAKPFVYTQKSTGQRNYVMHEEVGAEMAEGISRRLKFSNERREFIASTILHHMDEDSVLRNADLEAR